MWHSTFKKLKVNQSVTDTWYGPGKVIKLLNKGAWIKLCFTGKTERYDISHINGFIKITSRHKCC